MDTPGSSQDTSSADGKLERLRPHIAPLTVFAKRLRAEHPDRHVPWFDPDEAGDRARILMLQEAPGPKAIGDEEFGGSGFVSPDNCDPTARNTKELLQAAGIVRDQLLVTWNVVPWYLGDSQRIAAARSRDLDESRQALRDLLDLLPRLRVVVLLGKKAAEAWERAGLSHEREDLCVLGSLPGRPLPHPSTQGLSRRGGDKESERRERVRQALIKARSIAEA